MGADSNNQIKERGRKEKGSTFSLGQGSRAPSRLQPAGTRKKEMGPCSRLSTEATMGPGEPTQPEPEVTKNKAGAGLLGAGEVVAVILPVKSWLGGWTKGP